MPLPNKDTARPTKNQRYGDYAKAPVLNMGLITVSITSR